MFFWPYFFVVVSWLNTQENSFDFGEKSGEKVEGRVISFQF